MSTRTRDQAITWAKSQSSGRPGMYLAFARTAHNIPAHHGTARTAWQQATRRLRENTDA